MAGTDADVTADPGDDACAIAADGGDPFGGSSDPKRYPRELCPPPLLTPLPILPTSKTKNTLVKKERKKGNDHNIRRYLSAQKEGIRAPDL